MKKHPRLVNLYTPEGEALKNHPKGFTPWNIYPRPRLKRDSFFCLNGEWDFTVDMSKSGRWRDLKLGTEGYDRKITVPFCPESELSGVGITDFMPAVWYSRKMSYSQEVSKKIFFGAMKMPQWMRL